MDRREVAPPLAGVLPGRGDCGASDAAFSRLRRVVSWLPVLLSAWGVTRPLLPGVPPGPPAPGASREPPRLLPPRGDRALRPGALHGTGPPCVRCRCSSSQVRSHLPTWSDTHWSMHWEAASRWAVRVSRVWRYLDGQWRSAPGDSRSSRSLGCSCGLCLG